MLEHIIFCIAFISLFIMCISISIYIIINIKGDLEMNQTLKRQAKELHKLQKEKIKRTM